MLGGSSNLKILAYVSRATDIESVAEESWLSVSTELKAERSLYSKGRNDQVLILGQNIVGQTI